jgi:hypothetical protein
VGGRGTNIAGCGGCYEEKRCGTLIKKYKVGAQTENRQRLRVIEVDKYAFFVIMFI